MANEIVSSNVAQAIVKLVAADFLPPVVGNLVMGNIVNRNYEATLAQAGDVVNVPIAPNMSANNIAEAGTVTNQSKSLGNAQVLLNRHIEASFAIPDVTRILTVPDLLALYTQSAVIAIAEQIETDILNTYAQFNFNTAAGTANTSVTEAAVDTAETSLFTAKVPAGAPKFLAVSGTAYGQIRQLPRFTELQTAGVGLNSPSPIITGSLGQIKGFNVFRSQYVAKVSTTTYNLAGTRDSLALVMRRLPLPLPGTGAIATYAEMAGYGMRVTMSYTPSQLQQQFTVDALYGVGVLRNNFGIQLLS